VKTDEELVNEIMEAGYGHSKPSLLGTAAHYGAKMAAKGIYKGVKAAKNAYDSHPNVQMANQAELRQNVYRKLNQDFAHWEQRISGSTGVEPTEANLLAFAKEVYGFDATSVLSTIRTAPKTATTPKAAPAAPGKAPAAQAGEIAPAPAPAAKNPRVVQQDKDGKPFYKHDSRGINFDDPTLNDPTNSPITTNQQRNQQRFPEKPQQSKKGKPHKKESIDLSKSFSQIVKEADAAAVKAQAAETDKLNTEQTHAFFDGMARLVLGNPQMAQNFIQNGQIGAPTATNTQASAPAQKGAGKAPTAPAEAGPGNSALKAELNKIITKMGAKIDPSVIQSLTAKLKETPDLKSAVDLVDSPQEIAAARAIMIAVIIATEM
jgi:ribosomal protein L12E/L44/L45/RPP1/RPP2